MSRRCAVTNPGCDGFEIRTMKPSMVQSTQPGGVPLG